MNVTTYMYVYDGTYGSFVVHYAVERDGPLVPKLSTARTAAARVPQAGCVNCRQLALLPHECPKLGV